MNDELEIVRGFLKERLNLDPIRIEPTATLEELGIDSLMLLELFFEFEEKLGITLAQNLPTPKTVGQLIGIVEQLRRPQRKG
jgi:acyl carrier protein